MSKIEDFEKITQKMSNLYKEKNKNYGDAFDKSLDEDGLLVSKIRIGDKYLRFVNLVKTGSNGTSDESLKDTLIDLANYAVMSIMWIERREEERNLPITALNIKY